jgi:hypothetical protein
MDHHRSKYNGRFFIFTHARICVLYERLYVLNFKLANRCAPCEFKLRARNKLTARNFYFELKILLFFGAFCLFGHVQPFPPLFISRRAEILLLCSDAAMGIYSILALHKGHGGREITVFLCTACTNLAFKLLRLDLFRLTQMTVFYICVRTNFLPL